MPNCPRCEELKEALNFSKKMNELTQNTILDNEKIENYKENTKAEKTKLLTSEYLEDFISSLPANNENLTNKNEYIFRLKTCKNCENLKENVLCSWCGCYVALRARGKSAYCPHPNGNKWKGL